ncbi:MAG: nickel-dependent lactate racemase [Spirochaetales bacterium]|jgi:nickel-dependent lactate racemase|nr:nickel-dependent lactate racemase [Spirochaetales bacterium]
MKVELLYGKGELEVELPEDAQIEIIEPRYQPGLIDQLGALNEALEKPIGCRPLEELVYPKSRVGIVFSDISRATPYHLILPPLLEKLQKKQAEVIFINATGTHRINTEEELVTILGKEIVDTYRIVQNDCTDTDTHEFVGKTKGGNSVFLHRELLACDVKVLTGFIEPHFFAGFSGGGKALMPGVALIDTIQHNHGAENIDHGEARWGITKGNPIWDDVMEAAGMVKNTFLLNVAMNKDKQITRVFAGDLCKAHAEGVAYVKEQSMAKVQQHFDIVLTSNSGYPLDLNLYQTVKGMSAAREIVKEGGDIIIASDCWDGLPSHGFYGKLLSEADSPKLLLKSIRHADRPIQDMWQAQIHAKICLHADVHLYTENLSNVEVSNAFLHPVESIEKSIQSIKEKKGIKNPSICVLPEGPLTIPYIGN